MAQVDPVAEACRASVAEASLKMLDQVIARLEGDAKAFRKETLPSPDVVLFDLNEAGRVYVQAIMPFVREALQDGAERFLGMAELGNDVWDVSNPRVEEWLKRKTLQIKTLPETMHADIRRALVDVVQEGGTIQDMIDRLREDRPDYEWWKAERIARTEIVGANNRGAFEGMAQNGIEYKEWSTSEDERVRPANRPGKPGGKPSRRRGIEWNHRHANREVVAIDQPFIRTGEALMHPGASNGSAGNIIHCRCTILPSFEAPR